MIVYIAGNNHVMNVKPVNHCYHNNPAWATDNERRGKYATICSVSSTAIGCIKTFTREDAFLNKFLSFTQKTIDAIRNWYQYFLYGQKDDDLAFDKVNKPLAAKVGEIGCFIEKNINPIGEPVSALFGENIKESYSSIAHWFSSFWWRIRLCFEKVTWKELKILPLYIKELFHKDLHSRKRAREEVKNIATPILGLIGSFCTGLITPIKAWNKFKGNENKWIDALADGGISSQQAYYFYRFTLEELFNAQDNNNKNNWFLFGLGLATNIMNIALPAIDLLSMNNTAKTLWKELAQGLNRTFFSSRRHIKGREWLEANAKAG